MSIVQSSVRELLRGPRLSATALLSGVALAALMIASSPSMAQTAPAVAASGGTDQPPVAATALDQLQEVTVTAERVESNELRTPIAITALSASQLTQTNTATPADLQGLVPSLNIYNQGGGTTNTMGQNEVGIFIRGVGDTSRFFSEDLGVGVYVDDVYFPTTQNLNLSFYDLQSVQVLKGPQGTLFGRNTLGGALLLETTPPSQQFGGYAQVRIGSFSRLDTQGAVNLPFSDTLTSRFDFFSSNVNGYITHLLNDGTNDNINEKSVRYQLRFQPSSVFRADLMTEYGESHDNGNEDITVGCDPGAYYVHNYNLVHTTPYCTAYPPLGLKYTVYGNAVQAFPTPAYAYGQNPDGSLFVLGPSGLTSPEGRTPYDDGKAGTAALRLTWTVNDALTLKSITGLRRSDLDSFRDDGTPAGLYTETDDYWNRAFSQELQALINLWAGRLSVVTGLYYFHDNATSIQDTGPDYDDPVGYYYGNMLTERSWAGYLQATVGLTSRFNLIVGVRSTHDEKSSGSEVWEGCYLSYLEEYQTGAGGCWIPGPLMGDNATASGTWSHTDPRLQLQYQWTPDVMSYLSATSGYLSGGFNAQLPFFPPPGVPASDYYNTPFQQETVWDYEFGTKGEWLSHRLRVDFDAFDQIFDNFQAGVLQRYNGIDVVTTTSAADGHERGIEVELDAIPIPNLTLSATYSYLTQGYDAILPGARLNKKAALSSAPKDQYSLIANYTIHLSNTGTIVPAVNWRYVGVEWDGAYPLQYLAPGYAILGAELTYNSPANKWSVGLWGTNITNKYYFVSYSSPNIALGDHDVGLQSVVPGRPREVGASVRYNF